MGKKEVSRFYHAGGHWNGTRIEDGIIDQVDIDVVIGDISYDLAVKWNGLSSGPAAELSIFHDSFELFEKCPELFSMLSVHSDRKLSPSPQIVCQGLVGMGFVDVTERVKPVAAAPPELMWWRITLQDGDVQERLQVEAYTAADASELARKIMNDRWVVLSAIPEEK